MARSKLHQPGKRWPRNPATAKRRRRILQKKLKNTLRWGGKATPVGFPSMSPHTEGIRVFLQFLKRHTNNILTQTRGKGEKGFRGTQDLEREVIYMVANLLGVKCPKSTIDGYITSGGTEANLMGIWTGREKLLKDILCPSDTRISVLTSPMSHYSIRKACNVLFLGEGSWSECPTCKDPKSGKRLHHIFTPASNGSGLNLVQATPTGQIDLNMLEQRIRKLRKDGIRRFIIVLNEGTTLTGAMDDTAGAGKLIKRLRSEWGDQVEFYIHVDAAYGGFIYPFIDPNGRWGFKVPEVDSMTADPYKMGQAPLAQGIFLCRKGLQKYIERSAGYVHGQNDDTLIGSRPGAHAAAIWAIIMSDGFKGFEKIHGDSVKLANELHGILQTIPGIQVLPRMLNMVSFLLPDLDSKRLKRIRTNVINKYIVMWDSFNTNPEFPVAHPPRIVKCNITRDIKRGRVLAFAKAIAAELT